MCKFGVVIKPCNAEVGYLPEHIELFLVANALLPLCEETSCKLSHIRYLF